jgi:hypothetical protein
LCLRAGPRREDRRSEGERNRKKRCWSSHVVTPCSQKPLVLASVPQWSADLSRVIRIA